MLPAEHVRVTQDEFISLDHVQELPYLKHIELIKYSPKHFNLDKWTRLMVIPDNWMRKIYRNDVWRDTEVPEQKTETISKEQRRILYDWLNYHSPIRVDQSNCIETRQTRLHLLDCDDLIELFNNSEPEGESEIYTGIDSHVTRKESMEWEPAFHCSEPKIQICYKHKIQPESVIFEQACLKMNALSSEEEAQLQEKLKDVEFMKFLSDSINNFLEMHKNSL